MALFSKPETVRMHVDGMTCGGCQRSVEQALKGVRGVKGVRVDLEQATADVKGKNLDWEALVEAVTQAGFQAKPLP